MISYTTYREISPLQVPSVNPKVSIQCCHLGPPLSFLLKYCKSFCLLWTNNLKFRLLCLSPLPRNAKKSARVLIFAVNIAICTSEDPVSGPMRLFVAAMFVSGRTGCTSTPLTTLMVGALGGSCLSVLCRPNASTQRAMLTRMRSLLEPFSSAVIRAIASAARA